MLGLVALNLLDPVARMNARFRCLHGPSLWMGHAALLAEFEHLPLQSLPAEMIESRWLELDRKPLWPKASPPAASLAAIDLIAMISAELQHPEDPENARVLVLPRSNNRPCVLLGCIDPQASRQVLQMAIAVSSAIFYGSEDSSSLAMRLRQVRATLQACLPQSRLMRTLIHEAHALGIPVAPVVSTSRVWLFGQGERGVHFHQAATDGDSLTGARLSMNKAWSNQLVLRLGFPGMIHSVASDVAHAIEIARKLGYPVVVKPVIGGQGKGVSAYLLNDREVAEAYTRAAALSPNGVLVERFIAGDDHRLTVFGGRLAWVVSRRPARVVGDGQRSVADLITHENERRARDPDSLVNGIKPIKVDQETIRHLSKQRVTLESCLPQGVSVSLSSVANLTCGGILVDVTDQIHPDNRDMAESLARAFRMESFGIDFQTPDISRSWRDVPCGVVEVNATPGILFDSRVQRLLRVRFSDDSDGRIPSLLLIAPPPGLRSMLTRAIAAMGLCVGETDADSTTLGGMQRCRPDADLSARVNALIADPACQALVIETTATAIAENGLVLDRVDLAVACESLREDLQQLLQSCCRQLIICDPVATAQQQLLKLLDAPLLVDLAAQLGASLPRSRRQSSD